MFSEHVSCWRKDTVAAQPDWNFLPAQLRTHSSARGKNFSLITCHLAQGKIRPRDIQGQVGGACKINVSTQSFIKQDFNVAQLSIDRERLSSKTGSVIETSCSLSKHLCRSRLALSKYLSYLVCCLFRHALLTAFTLAEDILVTFVVAVNVLVFYRLIAFSVFGKTYKQGCAGVSLWMLVWVCIGGCIGKHLFVYLVFVFLCLRASESMMACAYLCIWCFIFVFMCLSASGSIMACVYLCIWCFLFVCLRASGSMMACAYLCIWCPLQ